MGVSRTCALSLNVRKSAALCAEWEVSLLRRYIHLIEEEKRTKEPNTIITVYTTLPHVPGADHSKQLVIDFTLTLPRLLLLRLCLGGQRLALAHGLALPREHVRRRDVRFIVQSTLDVECHVYRRGCSENVCERRGGHFVVIEATPLL
jgi:hypothetical protein